MSDTVAAPVCDCENCPAVPDENSKCCQHEGKVKEMCSVDKAGCIIRVAKMNLVWDKVR